ncbi:MAG: hypothetical protein U0935_23790 [Pirellulales bacterium]
MNRFFGWLLGLEDVVSIDAELPTLAAPWAANEFGTFWVVLAIAAGLAGSLVFYLFWQDRGSLLTRTFLGLARSAVLALIILTLAEPIVPLIITSRQVPTVFVLFDGTDSMAIRDPMTPADRAALDQALGMTRSTPAAPGTVPPAERSPDAAAGGDAEPIPSRIDYVRALLRKGGGEWLLRLERERGIQLQPYVFDGHTTSQLRKLGEVSAGRRSAAPAEWAEWLTTDGQVTALGNVLDDASQQVASGHLAGVILISDFAQNSGTSPLTGGPDSPLARLGVPLYTVGVGAVETVDLAVELQLQPTMKKGERDEVVVKLRSAGLRGQTATVQVTARKLGGEEGESSAPVVIGTQTQVLSGEDLPPLKFAYTPAEAGRFQFSAQVAPLPGEVLDQNNHAAREATIIDDYLRLTYVAFEPTWEWRFVKEVFHRDKLVGMSGFRTFLSSSDPRVRQSNPLFLPSLTPQRREFFAQDVVFLEDLPATSLGTRFPEMLKEYVRDLGGGLVVIAGPRFGLRELAQTPIADMLPVVIDPQARPRTDRPFAPHRTVLAADEPFMRLSDNPQENERAWSNLSALSWYQPVANVRESARVLAEHPSDVCRDGRTRQPLIATRDFGKGQVVYLGFNETWRLRRKYGEKYYREFWSQLIYRLGIGHALGDAKRFVPSLDRTVYRVDDKVRLRVEAYDTDYQPLTGEELAEPALEAELLAPDPRGGPAQTRHLVVPLLKAGEFETRFPVYTPGEYVLRVKDPIADRYEERRFEVTAESAERRQAVRDLTLQTDLASRSGGRSYELAQAERLADEIRAEPRVRTTTRNHALWTTPLWMGLAMTLLLGEWLARKRIQLV